MQTIDEVKKHCREVGEGAAEYHAAEGRREAIARRVRLPQAKISARGSNGCKGSRSASSSTRRTGVELSVRHILQNVTWVETI